MARVPSRHVVDPENRENGASPLRSRRCNRGRRPHTATSAAWSREGVSGERIGSQKTCPIASQSLVVLLRGRGAIAAYVIHVRFIAWEFCARTVQVCGSMTEDSER